MLDLQQEPPLKFSQAARMVPGGGVHRATIARWCDQGVRGIRLECAVIGGRTVTTEEALFRFLEACRARRWDGIANGHAYELALAARDSQKLQNAKRETISPNENEESLKKVNKAHRRRRPLL